MEARKMTWTTAQMCQVCLEHEAYWDDAPDMVDANCPRCGQFRVTRTGVVVLKAEQDYSRDSGERRLGKKGSRKRANASAWVREHQGTTLNWTDAERLAEIDDLTIPERAEKLLRALISVSEAAGQEIDVNTPEWQARAWALGQQEVRALAEFLQEKGLASIGQQTLGPTGIVPVRITAQGWENTQECAFDDRHPVVNPNENNYGSEKAPGLGTTRSQPLPENGGPLRITRARSLAVEDSPAKAEGEVVKKKVRFFVSYARANKELAGKFMAKLLEQLRPSAMYKYETWQDSDILVGEDWHNEIQKALQDCDFGLLLVSPAFLGSQYIEDHELPKFLGKDSKPVIPVVLQRVDLDRDDLKGLKKRQLFRLEGRKQSRPKAFGECSTGADREKFAQELFRQIENVLDKFFGKK
ncbi:MAG: toll/interleukin-1 receptor domain-containing protein [Rhodothermia bacterium]